MTPKQRDVFFELIGRMRTERREQGHWIGELLDWFVETEKGDGETRATSDLQRSLFDEGAREDKRTAGAEPIHPPDAD